MTLPRSSRVTVQTLRLLGVAVLVLFIAASAAAFPRPTIYGQIASTHIEGTVIFWDGIQVVHDQITLNVTAPCGDLTQVFQQGETPFFDVGKLTGEVDGTYTWELVATPTIDPDVQKKLAEVRGTSKEQQVVQALWDAGLLPRGPFREAGFFEVERGLILPQDTLEEGGAKALAPADGLEARHPGSVGSSPGASTDGGLRNIAAGTVLTNANGVIRNSLCVGFDCPDSPSFSDTTILMMENNTRIKFDDTSTINSFPRNDWEIEANSNLNGGGSWLAINDCGQSSQGGCANDPLLLVEAGAPSNSLRIDNGGRVGLGTANPVVELHVVDGDTPTLRLDQDTSSGFAQQVWDVAGNETSFFVRDATNGSTLPFRIRPGAGSNSLVIDSDNDVGIGVLSPSAALHVSRSTSSATSFKVENTNATAQVVSMVLDNTAADLGSWEFRVGANGNLLINDTDATGQVLRVVAATGEVVVPNDLTVNGTFSNPSSRTLKTDFRPVDRGQILERLAELPISEWSYISDGTGRRHIGPFTEDFRDAFGLGTKGKNIIPLDVQGVTIVAVQGLYDSITALKEQNSALLERLKEGAAETATLESRVAELEALLGRLVDTTN